MKALNDNKDPIYESVEVTFQVPKQVDNLWRALGYGESDYQYDLYDTTRSVLELIGSEVMPPRFKDAIRILEDD